MIQLTRYLEFLEKTNLVPQQFLLLLCLQEKNYDAIKHYKKLYPSEGDDSMIGDVMLHDLLRRGFIRLKPGKTELNVAGNLILTDKFTELFTDKYKAADEFNDIYPDFIHNEGKKFPTKNWNEDHFVEAYNRKIQGLYAEHIEVLKDLEFGKKHSLITCKMETFVLSAGWKNIRKVRLGQEESTKPIRERKRI